MNAPRSTRTSTDTARISFVLQLTSLQHIHWITLSFAETKVLDNGLRSDVDMNGQKLRLLRFGLRLKSKTT